MLSEKLLVLWDVSQKVLANGVRNSEASLLERISKYLSHHVRLNKMYLIGGDLR